MATFKTDTQEVLRALTVDAPRGNRWFKVNLHVHGQECDPAILVDHTLRSGVQLIAITDHQTFDTYPAVAEAANAAGGDLVVLPGIEITSVEGVHLLAIFQSTFDALKREQFIGWLEIAEKGDTRHASKVRVEDILSKVALEGGIIVIPHPFSDDIGLFDAARKMGTREQWLDSGHIQFVELSTIQRDRVRFIGHDEDGNWVNRYVLASASDEQVTQSRYCLAPINRGDTYAPEDVGDGCTWMRMGEPSINGLKQVTCEPRTRISFEEPDQSIHDCILGLQVAGGFCDGEAFWFNDGLNCLVGQNYAGKSAVFDLLRFALEDETTLLPGVRQTLLRRLNAILKPAGKVEVYVRRNRRLYVLRREYQPIYAASVPNEVTACSEKSQAYSVDSESFELIPATRFEFPLEVYEQGRIGRLREDLERQLEMLDEFAGLFEKKKERDNVIALLFDSAEALAPLYEEREECVASIAELPALKDELREKEAILPDEKDSEWARAYRLVQRLIFVQRELEQTIDDIPAGVVNKDPDRKTQLEKLFAQPSIRVGEEPVAAKSLLETWAAALAETLAIISVAENTIRESLAALQNRSAELQTQWAALHSEYETALRARLATAGVDSPAEIISRVEALRNRVSKIEEVTKPRHLELMEEIRMKEEAREKALARLRELNDQIHEERLKKAEELTAAMNSRMRISLEESGDISTYVRVLNELCDRITSPTHRIMNRASQLESIISRLSPLDLAAALRDGGSYTESTGKVTRLSEKCAVTENTVDVLTALADDVRLLNRLQCVVVPDVPRIMVRRHGEESYGDLRTELSPGEQSAAILGLALQTREMPLLLDQPEDELGYNFVVHLIVARILEAKSKRQLLVISHNANIPVLGDADYLIKMVNWPDESIGRRCQVAVEGSFEAIGITETLLELEGGEQAFKFRQHRYSLP